MKLLMGLSVEDTKCCSENIPLAEMIASDQAIQLVSTSYVLPKYMVSVPLITNFCLGLSQVSWDLIFNELSFVIIMVSICLL